MKQKRYLYSCTNPTPHYRIVYRQYYVAGGNDKEKILEIYKKCEDADWDMEELVKIHNEYQKYKKKIKGINHHGDAYVLYLTLQGKRTYCGRYKTIPEALRMKRVILERGGEYIPVKKRGRRKSTEENRYISTTVSGAYKIMKNNEYYGTFSTLEDAREERDLLEQAGWDYSEMEAFPCGKGVEEDEKKNTETKTGKQEKTTRRTTRKHH